MSTKAWVRMSWVTIFAALLVAGAAHPILAAVNPVGEQTWIQVVNPPAVTSCPVDGAATEAFGRQLDMLTSFYEVLIGVLLGALAIAVGFALFTINFVSGQKAEAMARGAAKQATDDLFRTLDFQNQLHAAVEMGIEERTEELAALAEDLEGMYETLNKKVQEQQEKANGDREATSPAKGGRKPRQRDKSAKPPKDD